MLSLFTICWLTQIIKNKCCVQSNVFYSTDYVTVPIPKYIIKSKANAHIYMYRAHVTSYRLYMFFFVYSTNTHMMAHAYSAITPPLTFGIMPVHNTSNRVGKNTLIQYRHRDWSNQHILYLILLVGSEVYLMPKWNWCAIGIIMDPGW